MRCSATHIEKNAQYLRRADKRTVAYYFIFTEKIYKQISEICRDKPINTNNTKAELTEKETKK